MKSIWGSLGAVSILAFAGFLRAEDAPKPGEGALSPEQLRKQLLEKFDANGDGNLTGDELLKARNAAFKQFGAAAGPAGASFDDFKKKFDRDGDGELNPQERAAAMAAFQKARAGGGGPAAGGIPAGGGVGEAQAAGEGGKSRGRSQLVKRFDRDGDGKLSEDEKAEAQKALKAKKGEKPASKLTEAMKRFDTDGDGVLSDDEKAAAKKARKEKGKKPE